MTDPDHPVSERREPVPSPAPRAAPPQQAGRRAGPRKRDAAETTGYLAGRTATGLTRLLLRSRTVRQTLRNARDSIRDET